MKETVALAQEVLELTGEMDDEVWDSVLPRTLPHGARGVLAKLFGYTLQLVGAIDSSRSEYALKVTRYVYKTMSFREIW
jgi:hypothetical protein